MSRSRLRRRLRGWFATFYRPPVLGLFAIALGAAVATPHVVRLSRELTRQPIYLVEGGDVRISRPGEFVDPAFFREALQRAGLESPLSVADPTLVPKLSAALSESPWIDRVDHVSASLQHGVRVVLTYRRPVLMVQTDSGTYPVDEHGVVLPSGTFGPTDAEAFPTLTLFDGTQSAAGHRWRDQRVLDAARIVRQLSDGETAPGGPGESLWQRSQLRGVRPSADGSGFELWTAAGSRVIWGVAEGDGVVEPTTAQKTGKLIALLDRRGSLDRPAGPYRIDLRRWDVIVLEPLATARR